MEITLRILDQLIDAADDAAKNYDDPVSLFEIAKCRDVIITTRDILMVRALTEEETTRFALAAFIHLRQYLGKN